MLCVYNTQSFLICILRWMRQRDREWHTRIKIDIVKWINLSIDDGYCAHNFSLSPLLCLYFWICGSSFFFLQRRFYITSICSIDFFFLALSKSTKWHTYTQTTQCKERERARGIAEKIELKSTTDIDKSWTLT